ncbi:hypothetical protein [Thiolapillus sp.]|uniref:hypothetical protein n=1 Tax=Thiolapillus sp. TaxID=2017437 RepID=UPI003AF99358
MKAYLEVCGFGKNAGFDFVAVLTMTMLSIGINIIILLTMGSLEHYADGDQKDYYHVAI